MISAGTLSRRGVDPALDVVTFGLREQRLLFDPSPAPDSLVELFPLVARGTRGSREGQAFAGLLRQCVELNHRQTQRGQVVAGFLEGLATDLRGIELNDHERSGVLAAKQVAAAVRAPLRALAREADADLGTVADAVRAVDRVLARTPRAQALQPAVEYELGARAFALLRELCDRPLPAANGEARGG